MEGLLFGEKLGPIPLTTVVNTLWKKWKEDFKKEKTQGTRRCYKIINESTTRVSGELTNSTAILFSSSWIFQFQFLAPSLKTYYKHNSLPHMATNSNAKIILVNTFFLFIVRREYQQWQLHTTTALLTIPH